MGEAAFRKKTIGTAQKNVLEALLRVEVKQNFIEEFCQIR
jgi:hypothetical protein